MGLGEKGIQLDNRHWLPISLTVRIKVAHNDLQDSPLHSGFPPLLMSLQATSLLVLRDPISCLRVLALAISLAKNTLTCLIQM